MEKLYLHPLQFDGDGEGEAQAQAEGTEEVAKEEEKKDIPEEAPIPKKDLKALLKEDEREAKRSTTCLTWYEAHSRTHRRTETPMPFLLTCKVNQTFSLKRQAKRA